MDKIINYRKIIRSIMEMSVVRTPINMPLVENHLIIDKDENHFILLAIGWNKGEFIHEWLYHLQLKDGKIHVFEDWTDPGILDLLTEKGIPQKDIIPAYLPDYQPDVNLVPA